MSSFADESRYFDNPFRDYSDLDLAVPSVDKLAVKEQLRKTCQLVFSYDGHECRGGIYTGAAGITYSYLHIRPALSEHESRQLLPVAQKLYNKHIQYYEDHDRSLKSQDLPGFIGGKAGFDAVGAVLGKVTGNEKLLKQSLRHYAQAAEACKPINFNSRGGDELFGGRGGYLMGALWLQEQLGPDYQPVPTKDLKDVWNATLKSGRRYAESNRSPCPLMYSWHEKEYLGAAHGLSAILQMLLSFPDFLKQDPKAEKDIRATVDYYLTLKDRNGNFPSSTGKVGPYQLVHWCHGATGAAFMFAKAYLVFKDERYLNAVISAGECVWNYGLLKKGPGICHGVAGNGYVFLLLHRLLNENGTSGKYLYRASKFAEFLRSEQFRRARTPDRPYSLYEGLAGTACFLADLLNPDTATFPFFNVFYNYQLP